jgi:hypothetical protein
MDDEMGREYSTRGEKVGIHEALVGEPEGNRLQGRYRRRLEDNIKINLR